MSTCIRAYQYNCVTHWLKLLPTWVIAGTNDFDWSYSQVWLGVLTCSSESICDFICENLHVCLPVRVSLVEFNAHKFWHTYGQCIARTCSHKLAFDTRSHVILRVTHVTHTHLFSYSTDQMQGIRRTRFDCILNAFIASGECVYR